MISINDVRVPTELFDALDGDTAAFVAKLKSSKPLSRPERDCLAYWLENGCRPPARKKGRARNFDLGGVRSDRLGSAVQYYLSMWQSVRDQGWHLKRAGENHWKPEEMRSLVAKEFRVPDQQLKDAVNRTTKTRETFERKARPFDYIEAWVEHLEKRHKK